VAPARPARRSSPRPDGGRRHGPRRDTPARAGDVADLTIRVEGAVLDYRDTAEIARILRTMYLMGLIPWSVYQTSPFGVKMPLARDSGAD
jgi:hypothetical protein